ncbi:MAG: hypothetical protein LIO55_08120 [Oscillospiraceae bacterium]|nr:hypothetical protein [Oscillospiraceae bacterium]
MTDPVQEMTFSVNAPSSTRTRLISTVPRGNTSSSVITTRRLPLMSCKPDQPAMAAPDWDSLAAAAENGTEKQIVQEKVAEAASSTEIQCSTAGACPWQRLHNSPSTSAASSRNGVSAL